MRKKSWQTLVAQEGLFCDPEESVRGLLDKIRTNLDTKVTTLDAATDLDAKLDAEIGEINNLLTSISNAIAETRNGAKSKEEALTAVKPLVSALKEKCTSIGISDAISAGDEDICETELAMLREVAVGAKQLVTEHIAKLRDSEGADQEGKAATLVHGANENYNGGVNNMDTMLSFMNNDFFAFEADEADEAPKSSMTDKVFGAAGAVGKAVSGLVGKVIDAIKGIAGWIMKKAKGLLEAIKKFGGKAVEKVTGGAKDAGEAIKKGAGTVFNTVKNGIADATAFVTLYGEEGIRKAKETANSAKEKIGGAVESLKKWGKTKVTSVWQFISGIASQIGALLMKLVKAIQSGANKIEGGVVSAISTVAGAVKSAASALFSCIGGGAAKEEDGNAAAAEDSIMEYARMGNYQAAIEGLVGMMYGNENAIDDLDQSYYTSGAIDNDIAALEAEIAFIECDI